MKKYLFFLIIITLFTACTSDQGQSIFKGQYNITWNKPSQNASESMPLVGGDIGCNVWVENGSLMLYVQRSGCLSENGEFLKMGRIRIDMVPNPFSSQGNFRQELILEDGQRKWLSGDIAVIK